MTKKCFKCGIEKSINDFYAHEKMKDGHLNKCKECTKIDVKIRYLNNPEKIKKYELNRSKKQSRIKYASAKCKEWRKKHPEKYKAHTKVNNAIRSGELTRALKCEICGGSGNMHAHHYDYNKPLEVIWLCVKCHTQIE